MYVITRSTPNTKAWLKVDGLGWGWGSRRQARLISGRAVADIVASYCFASPGVTIAVEEA